MMGSFSLSAQTTKAGVSTSSWPVQVNPLSYFVSLPPDCHKENSLLKAPTLILPNNMATAFFCRMEVKAEKVSKIPVLFRLGSVDHVERMEGKRKDMFIQ